ncbi:MAG: hypothetical protein EXR07_06850 [Acetobacteraceae bacterium]|nr:hypothetical protein [Acetobacteraceae bacterium]
MGKTSGSKQLKDATDDSFATDPAPLTPVMPCKKGKTLLKVFLRRIDTDAIVANEPVRAGPKSPGAPKNTVAGTGLADYGEVKPGTYFFDVPLAGALKPKFKPYATKSAGVPKQVDFHATLKIVPIARLRVVIFDREAKKVSGAVWKLTDPVAANGTTGADGLIDVEVPWSSATATLAVTLPKGKLIAAPAVVPADPVDAPPYPVTVRSEQWDPAPVKAKDAPEFTWTAEIDLLPDSDTDDGHKARLNNLGFPVDDAGRVTRSVKAYQRLHKKEYTGSGVLADIKAHLKPLHDTV